MQRFWDKVNIKNEDECWEWQAALLKNGYGFFGINRRMVLAHRVAWTLRNGDIPNKMCVCHHCDNPRCVNPDHLFLGTQTDNLQDMARKGRHVGNRKLTTTQIEEIKNLLSSGLSQGEIGKIYNVGHNTVSRIKLRFGGG